jgi:hypothetical protein
MRENKAIAAGKKHNQKYQVLVKKKQPRFQHSKAKKTKKLGLQNLMNNEFMFCPFFLPNKEIQETIFKYSKQINLQAKPIEIYEKSLIDNEFT